MNIPTFPWVAMFQLYQDFPLLTFQPLPPTAWRRWKI